MTEGNDDDGETSVIRKRVGKPNLFQKLNKRTANVFSRLLYWQTLQQTMSVDGGPYAFCFGLVKNTIHFLFLLLQPFAFVSFDRCAARRLVPELYLYA